MDHILHDLQFYANHTPKHKMTTLKQYSLLKRKMAHLLQKQDNCHKNSHSNGILKYKQNNKYWETLTEELNNLGPPYRTTQQWKKVWCDFKRGQRKRSINNFTPKAVQNIKKDTTYGSEMNESEIHIKSEPEDYDHNSSSIYTTFSNKYDNDYSYPDEESLHESYTDEKATIIPDESSCGSYTNLNKPAPGRSVNTHCNSNNKSFSSPPPLQRSHLLMPEQTIYTVQNQMEHQTKLLEHLSQTSTTIISLMERQAEAVEKQTEVINRQALAAERHTSVMNSFIDMIREKMFKGNAQKGPIPNENSTNDIL